MMVQIRLFKFIMQIFSCTNIRLLFYILIALVNQDQNFYSLSVYSLSTNVAFVPHIQLAGWSEGVR